MGRDGRLPGARATCCTSSGLVVKSHDTAKFLHAGFLAAASSVLALTLHRGRRQPRAALAGPLLFLACPAVGVSPAPVSSTTSRSSTSWPPSSLVLRRGAPAPRRPRPRRRSRDEADRRTRGGRRSRSPAALSPPARNAPRVPAIVAGMRRPSSSHRSRSGTSRARRPLLPHRLTLADGTARLPGVGADVYNHSRPSTGETPARSASSGRHPTRARTTRRQGSTTSPASCSSSSGFGTASSGWRRCVALPFLVYAAFASPPTRYLLPMLWGLSLAAAAVLARLFPRRGAWLAIPLALPGIFVSWDFQARNFGAADYLFGRYSKEEYLAPDDPGLPGSGLRQRATARRRHGRGLPRAGLFQPAVDRRRAHQRGTPHDLDPERRERRPAPRAAPRERHPLAPRHARLRRRDPALAPDLRPGPSKATSWRRSAPASASWRP